MQKCKKKLFKRCIAPCSISTFLTSSSVLSLFSGFSAGGPPEKGPSVSGVCKALTVEEDSSQASQYRGGRPCLEEELSLLLSLSLAQSKASSVFGLWGLCQAALSSLRGSSLPPLLSRFIKGRLEKGLFEAPGPLLRVLYWRSGSGMGLARKGRQKSKPRRLFLRGWEFWPFHVSNKISMVSDDFFLSALLPGGIQGPKRKWTSKQDRTRIRPLQLLVCAWKRKLIESGFEMNGGYRQFYKGH